MIKTLCELFGVAKARGLVARGRGQRRCLWAAASSMACVSSTSADSANSNCALVRTVWGRWSRRCSTVAARFNSFAPELHTIYHIMCSITMLDLTPLLLNYMHIDV